MREIKYRFWDKKNSEYFQSDYYIPTIDWNGVVRLDADDYEYSMKADWLEPEQYTGLKDCNGVEIYEGDYVRSIAIGVEEQYLEMSGAVWFQESQWTIDGTSDTYTFCWQPMDARYFNFEILGNIHQHPELLREGEQ